MVIARIVRAVGFLLVAAAIFASLRHDLKLLPYAAAVSACPFELGYGEGQVFVHTRTLLSGGEIYRPLGGENLVPCLYPPVFHLVTAAIAGFGFDPLLVGRRVSLASAFLLAIAVGWVVWTAAGKECERGARAAAAVFSAALFPGLDYPYAYAVLMRVDILANLLSVAGLLMFLAWNRDGWKRHLPFAAFTLAIYTRQTMVAAPAVCLCVLLLEGRYRDLVRAAATLLLGSLVLLLLVRAFLGSAFLTHVTLTADHPFGWRQALGFLSETLRGYTPLLGLALFHGVTVFSAALRAPGATSEPREGHLLLGLYFVATLSTTWTAGKAGADVNYLIEWMAAACACAGIVLARSLAPSGRSGASGRPAAGDLIACIAIPALLFWQATAGRPDLGSWLPVPAEGVRAEREELRRRIARAPGPVLSEDLILLAKAGKPVRLAFLEVSELARRSALDQSGLVREIAAREFSLIVSGFNVFHEPRNATERAARYRLTPEMAEAMRGAYRVAGKLGGYWIYEPAPRP